MTVLQTESQKPYPIFMRQVAEDIGTIMNGAEESGDVVPPDHIFTALVSLMERSIVDKEATKVKNAQVQLRVVAVEQHEVVRTSGKSHTCYRLLVSKAALDQLHNGRLTMIGLLSCVRHRYTKPGGGRAAPQAPPAKLFAKL